MVLACVTSRQVADAEHHRVAQVFEQDRGASIADLADQFLQLGQRRHPRVVHEIIRIIVTPQHATQPKPRVLPQQRRQPGNQPLETGTIAIDGTGDVHCRQRQVPTVRSRVIGNRRHRPSASLLRRATKAGVSCIGANTACSRSSGDSSPCEAMRSRTCMHCS